VTSTSSIGAIVAVAAGDSATADDACTTIAAPITMLRINFSLLRSPGQGAPGTPAPTAL